MFVAGFIGTPSMNSSRRLAGIAGDGQLAGFRPEHIQLGAALEPSISFEAAIEVVEYLGDEQLVHLRRHEHALVAKLPVEPRLTGSTRAALAVPLDRIALFDAVTEEAWRRARCPSIPARPPVDNR